MRRWISPSRTFPRKNLFKCSIVELWLRTALTLSFLTFLCIWQLIWLKINLNIKLVFHCSLLTFCQPVRCAMRCHATKSSRRKQTSRETHAFWDFLKCRLTRRGPRPRPRPSSGSSAATTKRSPMATTSGVTKLQTSITVTSLGTGKSCHTVALYPDII